MRKATGWTCQKKAQGRTCKHHNPPRTRKCEQCGKPRPVKRKPAHMAALDLSYEEYIKINGGKEVCGICGKKPSPRRKLDRDHAHSATGIPRGLLCHRCNRHVKVWVTIEWLQAAIAYLSK